MLSLLRGRLVWSTVMVQGHTGLIALHGWLAADDMLVRLCVLTSVVQRCLSFSLWLSLVE